MKKTNYYKNLVNKINDKTLKVSVIGLGYVGLPLSLFIAKNNFTVYGIDIDKKKILRTYKNEYLSNKINIKSKKSWEKNFKIFNNYDKISHSDLVIICVPTPLTSDKKPDLSYLKSVSMSLKGKLSKGTLVALESTSYPGTTKEFFIDPLKKQLKVGEELFVGFSPERIDPNRNENKLDKIPKVVSGYTNKCKNLMNLFYKKIFKKIHVAPSLEVAELSKLLENIYRAVNIGFINEMKFVAEKMNIDIYETILAAKTKPYGFRPFMPGPGIGGHCIPIDPYYLFWKAKKKGANARFIKLAGIINEDTQKRIVEKVINYLKKEKINKAKILIIGLGYKKNIDDMRESPSIPIIKALKKRNHIISYSDQYIKKIPKIKNFDIKLKNVKISEQNLTKFDCTLILADHDYYDYKKILKFSKIIFDTRFAYKKKYKKVVRI
tara:strand:- start:2072 stop:3379 length:1308 start_codon:yes stop_codon:yes gene_type:complete